MEEWYNAVMLSLRARSWSRGTLRTKMVLVLTKKSGEFQAFFVNYGC